MIEHLTGRVLRRTPHSLIIDVGGVGYGVEMPLSALCEAPAPGQSVSLWIDTYVREDALRLFGFPTFEDRQAFIMLRTVSGIGPKIALAILSTHDSLSLRQVILQNRVTLLESVPGVGKRTAEKIILELKTKIERLSYSGNSSEKQGTIRAKGQNKLTNPEGIDGLNENSLHDAVLSDVRSALENLGYRDKDINPVMANILQNGDQTEQTEFQFVLKSALKSLRAGQ